MRFLEKFALKQNNDKKLMMTKIACSMLESQYTSDDVNINTGAYGVLHIFRLIFGHRAPIFVDIGTFAVPLPT